MVRLYVTNIHSSIQIEHSVHMFGVFALIKVFIPNIFLNKGVLDIIRFHRITLNNVSDLYAHIAIIGQKLAQGGKVIKARRNTTRSESRLLLLS